jgi:GWxTD domain-containing protein
MRRFSIAIAVSVVARLAGAQSVPELFQKAKEQVKAGAWHEALVTMDALDTEAALPANQKLQSQLEGPLAFYRGVCEANLDQVDEASADLETFLRLQPNATIDEAAYSKKAVAAFEEARRVMAGPKPSLPRAYLAFQPPAVAPEPVTAAWAEGPVSWLMSDGEKKEWSKLKTDPERAAFVEKFWLARDSEDDHSFRATFEKRVAFSDADFPQDDKTRKRGSMTDRGMVFILLGPPTFARRSDIQHPSASIADKHAVLTSSGAAMGDVEVWWYRKGQLPKGTSYSKLIVEFVTWRGSTSNVLQRDADVLATLSAARKPA